jgi:peptidoglycan/LPS O-acetylase OafA/YrhL
LEHSGKKWEPIFSATRCGIKKVALQSISVLAQLALGAHWHELATQLHAVHSTHSLDWGFVPKGHTKMTKPALTFDSLTGLRFILALWIAVFHFGDMYDHAGMGSWPIMKAGVARVDVFFVLSGFVLTHVYWMRTNAKFDFAAFLQARFARLFPLHMLALSMLLALVLAAHLIGASSETQGYTVQGFVANVLLLQAWGIEGAGKWNFPAWTISAEFAGYMLFPLFLMLATCFRRAPLLFLACSVALALLLDVIFRQLLGRSLTQSTQDLGAVRGSAVMLIGVAGRVAFEKTALSVRAGLSLAGAGVLTAGIAAYLALSTGIVALGGVMIVIGLAACDRQGLSSALNSPVMVELGKWSYGIFILHVPLFMALRHASILMGYDFVVNMVTTMVCVCILIIASAAAHYVVEEPARKWLRGERKVALARAR